MTPINPQILSDRERIESSPYVQSYHQLFCTANICLADVVESQIEQLANLFNRYNDDLEATSWRDYAGRFSGYQQSSVLPSHIQQSIENIEELLEIANREIGDGNLQKIKFFPYATCTKEQFLFGMSLEECQKPEHNKRRTLNSLRKNLEVLSLGKQALKEVKPYMYLNDRILFDEFKEESIDGYHDLANL